MQNCAEMYTVHYPLNYTSLTMNTADCHTFVLATPISGPALIWMPQCDSRQMLLPTVLVMPTIRAPCWRQ